MELGIATDSRLETIHCVITMETFAWKQRGRCSCSQATSVAGNKEGRSSQLRASVTKEKLLDTDCTVGTGIDHWYTGVSSRYHWGDKGFVEALIFLLWCSNS